MDRTRTDRLGWRLGGPLVALAATLVVGTLGYVLLEGWSVSDAFFMVVTTITTVGFAEVHPLTPAGRWFTVGLIFVGVAGAAYTFSVLMGLVFEGHLSRGWERRRMERRVEQVRDHFIVCGYGRVGRQVAAELRRVGRPLVVIDVNPPSLQRAADDGLAVVEGNATEDDTLRRAGIARARGLIAAVASDADNIFVTLSARALRPDLPIVARANYDDAVPKLRRAGATQVVSPYTMAGLRMARLAVRPSAVEFVETLFLGADGELLLEDVRLAADSALVGVTIAALRQRFAGGLALLAVQRDGRLVAQPAADLILQAGDVLAAVGTTAHLRALERACAGEAPGTAARPPTARR